MGLFCSLNFLLVNYPHPSQPILCLLFSHINELPVLLTTPIYLVLGPDLLSCTCSYPAFLCPSWTALFPSMSITTANKKSLRARPRGRPTSTLTSSLTRHHCPELSYMSCSTLTHISAIPNLMQHHCLLLYPSTRLLKANETLWPSLSCIMNWFIYNKTSQSSSKKKKTENWKQQMFVCKFWTEITKFL